MAHSIPLVRSAALLPFLKWMCAQRLDCERRLHLAGLPATLIDEPERPIALVAGARFVRDASRSEGPDIGCRVVCDGSMADLSTLGHAALGARTPRGALARLMQAYGHHSSHENFCVTGSSGGVTVRHSFLIRLDDESLHVCQQYVAALILVVLAGTGFRGSRLTGIELVPHPVAGLGHLGNFFGIPIRPARNRTLLMTIPGDLLDSPYLRPTRERGNGAVNRPAIRGAGTLASSLRVVLPGMLEGGAPTLESVSALVPASARSFQRRLAAEGTSYSQILEDVRREQAVKRLADSTDPVGEIAADLGYSAQSSLSRAMRRWADASPSRVRRHR